MCQNRVSLKRKLHIYSNESIVRLWFAKLPFIIFQMDVYVNLKCQFTYTFYWHIHNINQQFEDGAVLYTMLFL